MKFVIATLAACAAANTVDLGAVPNLAGAAGGDALAAAKLVADCAAFVDQGIKFLTENKGKFVKSTAISSWEGKASCDRACGETFDFGTLKYPTGELATGTVCWDTFNDFDYTNPGAYKGSSSSSDDNASFVTIGAATMAILAALAY